MFGAEAQQQQKPLRRRDAAAEQQRRRRRRELRTKEDVEETLSQIIREAEEDIASDSKRGGTELDPALLRVEEPRRPALDIDQLLAQIRIDEEEEERRRAGFSRREIDPALLEVEPVRRPVPDIDELLAAATSSPILRAADAEAAARARGDAREPTADYVREQLATALDELGAPPPTRISKENVRAIREAGVFTPVGVRDFMDAPAAMDEAELRSAALAAAGINPQEMASVEVEFLQPVEMPPERAEAWRSAVTASVAEAQREWTAEFAERFGNARTDEEVRAVLEESGAQWFSTRIQGKLAGMAAVVGEKAAFVQAKIDNVTNYNWKTRLGAKLGVAAAKAITGKFAREVAGAYIGAGLQSLSGGMLGEELSQQVGAVLTGLVIDIVHAVPVVVRAKDRSGAIKEVSMQIVFGAFRTVAGQKLGAAGTFIGHFSEGFVRDAVLVGQVRQSSLPANATNADQRAAAEAQGALRAADADVRGKDAAATARRRRRQGRARGQQRVRRRGGARELRRDEMTRRELVMTGVMGGLKRAAAEMGVEYTLAGGGKALAGIPKSAAFLQSVSAAGAAVKSVIPESVRAVPAAWLGDAASSVGAVAGDYIPLDRLELPDFTIFNDVRTYFKVYQLAVRGNEYLDTTLRTAVGVSAGAASELFLARYANTIVDAIAGRQPRGRKLSKRARRKLQRGVIRDLLDRMQEREFIAAVVAAGVQTGIGMAAQSAYEATKGSRAPLFDAAAATEQDEAALAAHGGPTPEQVKEYLDERLAEVERVADAQAAEIAAAATDAERADISARHKLEDAERDLQDAERYLGLFNEQATRDALARQKIAEDARREGADAATKLSRPQLPADAAVEAARKARDAANKQRFIGAMNAAENRHRGKLKEERTRLDEKLKRIREMEREVRVKGRTLRDRRKVDDVGTQAKIMESLEYLDKEVALAFDRFKVEHPQLYAKVVGASEFLGVEEGYRGLLWQYLEQQTLSAIASKTPLANVGGKAAAKLSEVFGGAAAQAAGAAAPAAGGAAATTAQTTATTWARQVTNRRLLRIDGAAEALAAKAQESLAQRVGQTVARGATSAAKVGATAAAKATMGVAKRLAMSAARHPIQTVRGAQLAAELADIALTNTAAEEYIQQLTDSLSDINAALTDLDKERERAMAAFTDLSASEAVQRALGAADKDTREYAVNTAFKLAGYHPHKGRLRGVGDALIGAGLGNRVEAGIANMGSWVYGSTDEQLDAAAAAAAPAGPQPAE